MNTTFRSDGLAHRSLGIADWIALGSR